jgi:hypothetical protein
LRMNFYVEEIGDMIPGKQMPKRRS